MEKKVEEYLVKKTKEKGGVCLKWQSLYTRQSLDRLLFFPGGKLVIVEAKQKSGRFRPGQPAMIRLLRGLGFHVEVVWSKKDIDLMFENL